MPDVTEEIGNNLSPDISERKTEKHVQNIDGSIIAVFRETEKISREGDGITVDTISQTLIDDLGNPLQTSEDLGGVCKCGNRVHKDYFFHCQRCSQPLCMRCASIRNDQPYCNWCRMILGIGSMITGIFRMVIGSMRIFGRIILFIFIRRRRHAE